MTTKVVKWERWIPPSVSSPFEDDIDIEDDDDEDGSEFSYDDSDSGYSASRDMCITHQSPESIEQAHLARQFNFWVAHVNFVLTPRMMSRVENILGVESLDGFTPYRFRISVGKAFDEDAVTGNVKQLLLTCAKIGEKVDVVDYLRGTAKHKAWAILKIREKIDYLGGHSSKEVAARIPKGAVILAKSW